MEVGDTIVYLKHRATTTYDKKAVMDLLGVDECLQYGLLNTNDAAISKYLKQHPDIKIETNKGYTNPFLAVRKKNG
jgi:hypothetical protein